MWTKLPLLECFEYVQQLKLRLGSRNFNANANAIIAIIFFLLAIYLCFYKMMKVSHASADTPR